MTPVFPPFLLGLVLAPLAKRVVKPLVYGTLKTSVGLAMEVKKAAHQANEELHDLAAEVTAEMISTELRSEEKAATKGAKSSTTASTAAAATGKGR